MTFLLKTLGEGTSGCLLNPTLFLAFQSVIPWLFINMHNAYSSQTLCQKTVGTPCWGWEGEQVIHVRRHHSSQVPPDHPETPHLWMVTGPTVPACMHTHMSTHIWEEEMGHDVGVLQSHPAIERVRRRSCEQQFGGFWAGRLWRGFQLTPWLLGTLHL